MARAFQLASTQALRATLPCIGVSGSVIAALEDIVVQETLPIGDNFVGQNSYGASSGSLEQQELSYYCARKYLSLVRLYVRH